MTAPGLPLDIERKACMSKDRLYRYVLTRRWGYGPHATFIMLNPSTANSSIDDPTIRRCVGFARSWKLAGIVVLNLYALRSTDPRGIKAAREAGIDPVGPDNNDWIHRYLGTAMKHDLPVVAAWGFHADEERANEVLSFNGMGRALAFGLTAGGHPKHPLMLAGTSRPRPLRELKSTKARG